MSIKSEQYVELAAAKNIRFSLCGRWWDSRPVYSETKVGWSCRNDLHRWMASYDEIVESEVGCAECREEGVKEKTGTGTGKSHEPADEISDKLWAVCATITRTRRMLAEDIAKMGDGYGEWREALENSLTVLGLVLLDVLEIIPNKAETV